MFFKSLVRLSLASTLLIGACVVASAQTAREILSTFPDSQALLYVNTRRVFEEALPRVVPAQELEKGFADIQKETSFDVRSIHFVAVGARFKEPFSTKVPPDFVVLVKGTFNADALLSLARMAAQGSYRQETYKGRTLDIFNFAKKETPATTQGNQAPPKQQSTPFPIPELAAVTFDPNTVMIGVPDFVRTAVDASEGGQGRVRADLLDLVARNPDTLVSLGGDIPPALLDLVKSMGMPPNAELEKVVGSLRQVQTSVSMNANDFGAHSIVRTDTPENAQTLNGLVTIGLGFARMGIEQELSKVPANKPTEKEAMQTVLNLISTLRNAANGNEVQLDASIPQATVAEFVRKEMARSKEAEKMKAAAKKPVKKAVVRRKSSRRRR